MLIEREMYIVYDDIRIKKMTKYFVLPVEDDLANEILSSDAEEQFVPVQDSKDTFMYKQDIDFNLFLNEDSPSYMGYGFIKDIAFPSVNFHDELLYKSKDILMDARNKIVWKGDHRIHLTKLEYYLLEGFLTSTNNAILPRAVLIERIESFNHHTIQDNTLTTNINRLREALGSYENASYIQTFNGLGYKWSFEVEKIQRTP